MEAVGYDCLPVMALLGLATIAYVTFDGERRGVGKQEEEEGGKETREGKEDGKELVNKEERKNGEREEKIGERER